MNIRSRYREFADQQLDHLEQVPASPRRVPLTTGQHILHLLLTVLTAGLWAPVWFVRAWRGNRA